MKVKLAKKGSGMFGRGPGGEKGPSIGEAGRKAEKRLEELGILSGPGAGKRGLGSAAESQGAGAPAPHQEGETLTVRRDRILVKAQVRKTFSQDELQELADSIRQIGILQRLIVRRLPRFSLREPDMVNKTWAVLKDGVVMDEWPAEAAVSETCARNIVEDGNRFEFELVCGERRYRAAALAGVDMLPVEVKQFTDAEALAVQLVENVQRQDLNAFEEAEGMGRMRDELGWSIGQIVEKTGKKRSTVYNALQLLKLAPGVREAIASGKLQPTIGNLIAGIPTHKLQEKALKEILENKYGEYLQDDPDADPRSDVEEGKEPMSFRDAKCHIRNNYTLDLNGGLTQGKPKFDPECATYLGRDNQPLPSCSDCPLRSGNCPDLGMRNPNVCTDPECFKLKEKRHLESLVAKAEQDGAAKVLTGKQAEQAFKFYSDEPSIEAGYIGRNQTWPGMKKTVGDLLKSKMPAPVVAIKGGKQIKIWDAAAIEKALQEAGHNPKTLADLKKAHQTSTKDWKQREAEQKERKKKADAVANQALPMVLAAAAKKLTTVELLRKVAGRMNLYDYAERYGLSESDVEKKVERMSEGELRMLVYESEFLLETVHYNGEFAKSFLDECKTYGVDLEKVGNELVLGDGDGGDGEVDQETVEWLTGCPPGDVNFKANLDRANLATCEKALENKELAKAARKAIEARVKKLGKGGKK